jgi:hypothetical protein
METRYVFFPYLKSSGIVHYRHITFGTTSNVAHLKADIAEHVAVLASMFFLRDDLRIKDMTFAVLVAENRMALASLVDSLAEFQAFVCYLYSAPHEIFGEPFLHAEHASAFVFEQSRVQIQFLRSDYHVDALSDRSFDEAPDARNEVAGYKGRLDQRSPLWVAKGSRIYPPTTRIWLNMSQDLSFDIGRRIQHSRHGALLAFLEDPRRDPHLCSRVLRSLRWYNRSVAIDVAEEIGLVSLAIAFEALLGLPRGNQVTNRFKEAVALLVGPVDRLDSFLEQFYEARSEIAHEGETSNVMFRATDSVRQSDRQSAARYRSLAAYARHIFQVCLLTIVYGGHMTSQVRLSRMMTTNQERFEQMCRTLSSNDKPAGHRLQEVAELIQDADTYRFVPEDGLQLKTVLAVCKLASSDYLAMSTDLPTGIGETIREFVTVKYDVDELRALFLLQSLVEGIRTVPRQSESSFDDPHRLLAALLDVAWGYAFPQYFEMERARTSQGSK